MRLNRPKAKIRFKSDSNRLVIDFFDPKLSLDLIEIIAGFNQNRRDDSKFGQRF